MNVQSLAETPLHHAANDNDNPDMITRLVELGAGLEVRDLFGQTSLHAAARFNSNSDVITRLLEHSVSAG